MKMAVSVVRARCAVTNVIIAVTVTVRMTAARAVTTVKTHAVTSIVLAEKTAQGVKTVNTVVMVSGARLVSHLAKVPR